MSKTSYSPSQDNIICTDYLLVKPEEASFFDVFRLIWCKDKQKHEFIESPLELAQELRIFRYRWLVLISILVQKFLLRIRTPLALAGSVIDFWLNLVSNNGGLLKLIINFITGNLEISMDESKETYRSIIGNLDTRTQLDPSIPMGDPRYPPALSCMAAKLSYENPAFIQSVVNHHWKMELLGCYDFWNEFQGKSSTHGFMLRNATKGGGTDLTVVAFSGTQPFSAHDWCTDFDISWLGLSGVGRVHAGFMKALGLQKIGEHVGWPKEVDLSPGEPVFAYYKVRQVLRRICQENKNAKFILTGHSLGGALAILFASVLMLHDEKELLDRLEGIYTFGQPRVGDEEFGEFMKKKLATYNVRYCRYVYCNDMVPRLPYDDKTLLFKHFGPCIFYDSFYNGKEMEEEPNKNYFSLMWVIPKYMNAWWELIRGFTLPYVKWGSEYKEGWCQRAFRVIGLIIPGLAAHGPQDYDNLTRLGRLPSSKHHKHKSH